MCYEIKCIIIYTTITIHELVLAVLSINSSKPYGQHTDFVEVQQ